MFFLPKATKHGTFQGPSSKMFPHWPLSIGFILRATKHGMFEGPPSLEPFISHQADVSPLTSKHLIHFKGPPNMEYSKGHEAWNLPLPTRGVPLLLSFPSSLKVWIWIICLFFFFLHMISYLNIWKLVIHITFLGRRTMISPNRMVEKRRID